jgi:cation diffusion facilitator CzcD-associated flavoprotein CzcO
MEHCARNYGLLPHCRFGKGVRGANWDERRARWTLTLERGEPVEADVVVSALGMFNGMAWPSIAGLDSFAGTRFHSARWNSDHDLRGESVGVIGSAASAVQFVPEIAKEAGQVHLFQHTANWVLPKEDEPYTAEQLDGFRKDPSSQRALHEAIYQRVDGGMTFSNPAALAEMEAAGLAALEAVRDPELRRVDTLIFATGFATTKYLSAIEVAGRGGRRLDDAWRDGPWAYLGITTAGFPNLFMLYGPNTNNGSILEMIEAQVDYALRQIRRIADERLA